MKIVFEIASRGQMVFCYTQFALETIVNNSSCILKWLEV
jgi:hypothetical protein